MPPQTDVLVDERDSLDSGKEKHYGPYHLEPDSSTWQCLPPAADRLPLTAKARRKRPPILHSVDVAQPVPHSSQQHLQELPEPQEFLPHHESGGPGRPSVA